jgi:EAL domain-containing protein (putative c-di-GMP-specific phosphodiesterase class I)/FixJ family two-component response regulator
MDSLAHTPPFINPPGNNSCLDLQVIGGAVLSSNVEISPRILVADDDRLVLSTLCVGLTRAGYQVEAVASGEAALHACQKNLPDLVVLDHNMPGITGLEVAEQIRNFTNIPILMLTAYDDTELIQRAAKQNINGYFVKPIDSCQLVPSIELSLNQVAVRDRGQQISDNRIYSVNQSADSDQPEQETLIRHALEKDRIELLYQPILDIQRKEVRHYEALLRLVGPDGGLISPDSFMSSAERSGLIRALDYRVLQIAVTQLAAVETNNNHLSISLNLSGVHFGNPELMNRIKESLLESQISPEHLIFEVTETAAMKDLEQAKKFITMLKDMGCRFALDDFGTGYASFYYLRCLPVDYIKIDGAFVRDMINTESDGVFVKAMVDVARGLGIRTIAEYVNDKPTLTLLGDCGVDFAQGYFIGRPGAFPLPGSIGPAIQVK